MWQVADWLESYAHSLELDVWTSSTVTRAQQDPETKKWTVEVERANAEPRTFVVNHLVFAIGFAGGTYKTPQIPGAVRDDVMPETHNPISHSVLGRVQGQNFALVPLYEGQRLRGEKGSRGGCLHVW